MKLKGCNIVIILLLASWSLNVAAAQSDCIAALLMDQRFHWAKPYAEVFDIEEPERVPPNVFDSQMRALSQPLLKQLPDGLTRNQRLFYQGIFDLLRDRARVFSLTQQVIQEIDGRVGVEDHKSEDERVDQNLARRRAFLEILSKYERKYRFKVTKVSAAVESREWLAYVHMGYVLDDEAGRHMGLTLSSDQQAKPGQWEHGRDTHRFQWHLVLRDVEQRPELYGHPKDVLTLYEKLGDRSVKLDWSETGANANSGPQDLFFYLFDSPENNPSSPGYFLHYREFWPGLPIE